MGTPTGTRMDDQSETSGQSEPSTSGQLDVAREYVEHMRHIDDVADKPLRVLQVTVQ